MPSKRRTTLGERLKHAREIRGLGSRETDRAAGLTEGHVAVIESAKRAGKPIDSTTATSLAHALELSLEWLLTGEGDAPTAKARAAS
jgi:transcriptional regulator with XRE-family HTH domain